GLAPIQRDGLEYEFDVVADMDLDNTLIVSKSRCEALSGAVIAKPGEDVAAILKAWLTDGAPVQDTPQPQPAQAANSASKGGDESKREDYHVELWGYLKSTHNVSEIDYVSFVDYHCQGHPKTCDIDRLAELARYAFAAGKRKSQSAAQRIAALVDDWRKASEAEMVPDVVSGGEIEQEASA